MPPWLRKLLDRLARQCAFIVGHFLVAMLFAVLGFIAHHLLLLMGDPKLYDAVPWRYVADTADLALVVTFIVMGIYEAVKVFRGDDDEAE